MRVYKIIDGLAQVFSVVFNDKVVNAFQYFKNQVRWYGKKRKFRRVGNNVHLEFPAKILTPDKIEIGDNVFIAENAILEVWGDNPDACMDLENNENAVTSVIEIQCYSNKSNTETRNIINKCCDAMRMMGYRRTYGPKPVTNASDTSIYRAVARFTRLVSAVDEIEKFGTKGAQSSLF